MPNRLTITALREHNPILCQVADPFLVLRYPPSHIFKFPAKLQGSLRVFPQFIQAFFQALSALDVVGHLLLKQSIKVMRKDNQNRLDADHPFSRPGAFFEPGLPRLCHFPFLFSLPSQPARQYLYLRRTLYRIP
jgi:hypothetical protein